MRRLNFIALALLSPLFISRAYPQVSKEKKMNAENQISALIPNGYTLKNTRAVPVDGEEMVLSRYERSDGVNGGLMGENFSMILNKSGLLKGFVSYQEGTSDANQLPGKDRSEKIARDFLRVYAPDLLQYMEVHWVKPHDEIIKVKQQGGKTKTIKITGMKVKCRNVKDGRWFWVIVSSKEKPFVFERDIVWINFPGMRKTEKWLHDSWLANK